MKDYQMPSIKVQEVQVPMAHPHHYSIASVREQMELAALLPSVV